MQTTTADSPIVIFDMDGTLTRPLLNFDLIRAEIGLGKGPVLEAVQALPPDRRPRAEAILQRHEDQAAAASELQPGAATVVASIRAAGIPAVLMTRNTRRSVDVVLARHGLTFDLIWTREDGPMKPSPEPILEICRRLNTDPRRSWAVGDFHYDILCGAAAGSRTVLLVNDRDAPPDWATEADEVIYDLVELLDLLKIPRVATG